ncbi:MULTISPECIES: EF-P beta-lysylation protein EpmB [Gammaproteobacteria]|uniref:EF-P beta-lysylation protein EpmB n=1 Tax=Gammaproteobacteria TaxID=1236 RepID=UPI000DCFFDF5|nr:MULTISPECIES: EF-P beta-lysylation protein EpmB [Gammaproteobacteria]RTE85681.1 EF-P beta-lysylation protein EpmB [Aliidiomarina sp. B3213]TCZ90317.1 EF-P beta-lysylation protein EpmB [Lysobacter sp. N42]
MASSLQVRPQWQQEIASSITSPEELGRVLNLDESWIRHNAPAKSLFPLRVPKPFVALMGQGNPNDPLLKQVMTSADEFQQHPDFVRDPLLEQQLEGPSSLLHKYKSRVLIIFRGGCAVNCRYCFRRHFPYEENHFGREQKEQSLEYIRKNVEINEVILSGGDPLMASDQQIEDFVRALESIDHIKRIRIHSRLPIVIPSRLTNSLAKVLESSRLKSILVLHANHPNELSEELKKRLSIWQEHGILLLNQSVLLKGINDDTETLVALSEKLFDWQVLPYYLHLLDKVEGASHFNVEVQKAQEIYQQLLVELPGFLVPKLVQEVGGELSKTPISAF